MNRHVIVVVVVAVVVVAVFPQPAGKSRVSDPNATKVEEETWQHPSILHRFNQRTRARNPRETKK